MIKQIKSLFCAALFFTCIGLSEAEEPIQIGALMPLTGQFAMQGTAFTEGLQLAEDEINAAGGINGKQVKVIVEDTHGDPKAAHTAAGKLIEVDKVVAAITCSYPDTKVGGTKFQEAKIPSIALWDSSPEIDEMGDYIFSIGPWVLSSGEKAAEFSAKDLNAKTAVIINTVEEWSELIPEYFEAKFNKLGGKVLKRFRVNPEDSDFRTVLTKTKSLNPDVIYAPLTHNIVAFHKQLNSLELNKPIVSSDIISDEHLSQAPKELEGVYQTNVKDPENKIMKALAGKYEKRFKKELSLPWFVATGYDAVMLIAHTLKNGAVDSQGIKTKLYKVEGLPGAAQVITINAKGSSPHYEKMFQVRNGAFEFVG